MKSRNYLKIKINENITYPKQYLERRLKINLLRVRHKQNTLKEDITDKIIPLAYVNYQQSHKLGIWKTNKINKSLAILLRKKEKRTNNIRDAKGDQLADFCMGNNTRYSLMELLFQFSAAAWIKYAISFRGWGWLANNESRE